MTKVWLSVFVIDRSPLTLTSVVSLALLLESLSSSAEENPLHRAGALPA